MAVQLLKAEPGTTVPPPTPRLGQAPLLGLSYEQNRLPHPTCLSQVPLKGRQAGFLSPKHSSGGSSGGGWGRWGRAGLADRTDPQAQ